MARTTTQARYASRAVSGTSALDPRYYSRYGTAVPVERPVRPKQAPQPQRRAQPQAAPKVAPRPRVAPKQKRSSGVSLFAVFGFMTAAVLIVFVLLLQVRYEEVRSEAVTLQAELQQLSELERRLRIEYEDAFDVMRVEEYATSVLGMTKPASTSRAGSIPVPAEDKALVVMEEVPEQSGLSAMISSVLAYFKTGG
jgi:cell division protein FtsL